MAAASGRKMRISIDGTPVAGIKTETVSFGNDPVDITDKDSDGFVTLLGDVGTRKVDASGEGVLIDDTLMILAAGGDALISNATIDFEGLGSIAGDFFMSGFEVGGAHDGEITFSASFQSSGAYTYTAEVV